MWRCLKELLEHNPNRLLNHADLNERIQLYIDRHRGPREEVRWEYTLGGRAAPPGTVQAGSIVPIVQIFIGIKNGLLNQPSEVAEYVWFILEVETNPIDEVLNRGVQTGLQYLRKQRSDLLNSLNGEGQKGIKP
jgi:hypothetical protein